MKDIKFEIRHLRMEIKRETSMARHAEDIGRHKIAAEYRSGLKGKKKRLKELLKKQA